MEYSAQTTFADLQTNEAKKPGVKRRAEKLKQPHYLTFN